jgi:hypothetical protein
MPRTFRQTPQPNNRSGISGVSETHTWGNRAGGRYKIPCLDVAFYELQGRETIRRSKRFYFSHFQTEEECWREARKFKAAQDKDYQAALSAAGIQFTIR